MITLAIDAATLAGSVAVLRGDAVVAEREALMRGEHEERLMPAVAAALADAGCALREIDRIVCGAGPGSFTSLRIAGAIAKGAVVGNRARGRDTSLFAVSSLALIVAGRRPALPPGRYLALLDAMRGERYAALFEVTNGGETRELDRPANWRISENDVKSASVQFRAQAIGPREAIQANPHARGVTGLLGAMVRAGPVSVDDWEPDYGRLAEAQVKWEAAQGRSLSMDVP